MKIAFFEIKDEEKHFFESNLSDHELFFYEGTIQDELNTVQAFDIVSLFVHSRIDTDVLSLLPALRYLQTRSTGYDHIKCKELYKREMKVSNVTGYAGASVAEFAFSLLLNASRHTHTALARAEKGGRKYLDLIGFELQDKTLGIIGLGTIGLHMAQIAKGFGMKILGHTRSHRPVYRELGIEIVELDEVLSSCDVLMVAVPLTPSTTAMINSDNAKLLKEETVIINIARCEVIEPSLYSTLPNPIASDVCDDITLAQKQNFFYTPHMAYYTTEALQRILDISLENMLAFIAGNIPKNCLKLACQKEY